MTSGAASEVPEALQSHQYRQELQVAVDAARAAGELIRAAFSQEGQKEVQQKSGLADLVTATDKACEDLILGRIRAAFPDHAFIGEEGASAAAGPPTLGDGPTWMVDPLDGTTNFVHGFPFVCTSIGLTVGRKVVLGVVYNPVLRELFVAAAGGGAYLNGRPLRASGQEELSHGLLGTEVGVSRQEDAMDATFGRVRALTSRMRSVRCSGSCALGLCGVAAGRLDAFYEINFGGCWDAAAGALMVAEAGGMVADPQGGPWDVMSRRVLAAGSVRLAEAVAAVLAECKAAEGEPAAPPAGFEGSLAAAAAAANGSGQGSGQA